MLITIVTVIYALPPPPISTFNPYIIHWNANGLGTRVRLGEFQRLLQEYVPMCICVQHVGQFDSNILNYELVSQSHNTNNELGTSIYVHCKLTFHIIPIPNAFLQHSPVILHIAGDSSITTCNIYKQPAYHYDMSVLQEFINSLPQPVLLMGDFDRHKVALCGVVPAK